MDVYTVTIDGQAIQVPPGTTILKAAEQLGVRIPTICFHDYCTANALCRLCVVEVEGVRLLSPACVVRVSDGMMVRTRTTRIERSRRTILEMLASTVDLSDAAEIQALMKEYAVDCQRFPEASLRQPPVLDDNPMYIRDYAKCVLCWRCVQVCAEDAQYTFAINFSQRGFITQIATFYDKPMLETTCVFCGQCVGVCPTGALKSRRQWLIEQANSPGEVFQANRPGRGKQ